MRWLAEVGAAFELTYPQLTRLGLRAIQAQNLPRACNLQARTATLAFYRRLVEVGKQQGNIAADMDPELAAVVFDAVLNSVGRYIIERVAGAGAPDGRSFLEHPEVKALFARTVSILEHGMGSCASPDN